MALTREQVTQYLYDAGFRGDDLTKMLAIGGRESAYDPAAHRSDQPKSKLSGDMGLFQINYTNWPLVSKALGLTDKSQLFDPAINAKAAKVLFDASGYDPWTMGSNGWQAGGDPMKGTDYAAAKAVTDSFKPGGSPDVASDGRIVYQVMGGPDGEGSFIGFVKNPDGTLERLDGTGWAGLTSAIQPTVVSQEDFGKVIKSSKPRGDLPGGYLDASSEEAWQTGSAAATPTSESQGAATNPATNLPISPETTSLLSRFGISYENAPPMTPALLAFMRGLGLNQDTAEDTRSTALARLASTKTEAEQTIARNAVREKEGVTASVAGRGVLQSGEADTRYARQAEDVAGRYSGVASAYGSGVEDVESNYRSVTDNLRTRALETVIGAETSEATRKAGLEAEERSWTRQEEAMNRAAASTAEATERATQAQIDFWKAHPGAA